MQRSDAEWLGLTNVNKKVPKKCVVVKEAVLEKCRKYSFFLGLEKDWVYSLNT